tara:strand:- start:211 stop:642 length:432 start_codon:yes stop_codon:yes gene_type:complete
MTAQIREILYYKGVRTVMATEPLCPYLQSRKDICFNASSTAWWRGYLGTWKINDKRLFLVKLKGYINKDYKEVKLDYIFPGKKEVFADWFSGKIRISQGELLQYVHMGYSSVFEKDLFLKFKDGVLIDEETIDNRIEFEKNKK